MDLVTCKECRQNMLPWNDPSETCRSCKDTMRQYAEARRGFCSVCRFRRPWAGTVCFGCSVGKARAQSPSRKKRGWLWPLL